MVGVGPAGPGPSYVVAGTVDAAGTVAAHTVFLVTVVGAVDDDDNRSVFSAGRPGLASEFSSLAPNLEIQS